MVEDTSLDPSNKEFVKTTNKYGLNPKDLDNIDEDSLKPLDSSGDEISSEVPPAEKRGFFRGVGDFLHGGPPVQGGTGQKTDLMKEAKWITRKTKDGKEFKIKTDDWRKLQNLKKQIGSGKSGPSGGPIAPPGSGPTTGPDSSPYEPGPIEPYWNDGYHPWENPDPFKVNSDPFSYTGGTGFDSDIGSGLKYQ